MELIDKTFKKQLVSVYRQQPVVLRKKYKNYLNFLDQETNCSHSGLKKIQSLKTDCYLIYSDYYSLLNFLNKFKIEKLPKPKPKKRKIKIFYFNQIISIKIKIIKSEIETNSRKLTIAEILKKYNRYV